MKLKKGKVPSDEAAIAAVPGGVLIVTKDGSVILTPQAVRDIAAKLPDLATIAELALLEKPGPAPLMQ